MTELPRPITVPLTRCSHGSSSIVPSPTSGSWFPTDATDLLTARRRSFWSCKALSPHQSSWSAIQTRLWRGEWKASVFWKIHCWWAGWCGRLYKSPAAKTAGNTGQYLSNVSITVDKIIFISMSKRFARRHARRISRKRILRCDHKVCGASPQTLWGCRIKWRFKTYAFAARPFLIAKRNYGPGIKKCFSLALNQEPGCCQKQWNDLVWRPSFQKFLLNRWSV